MPTEAPPTWEETDELTSTDTPTWESTIPNVESPAAAVYDTVQAATRPLDILTNPAVVAASHMAAERRAAAARVGAMYSHSAEEAMTPAAPAPDQTNELAKGVGRAFNNASQALLASVSDVGQQAVNAARRGVDEFGRPIGRADLVQAPPVDAGEPPSNIEAFARGEPLPAETQARVLPPALRGPLAVSQGLVKGVPRLAAFAALEAAGVPPVIAGPLVFAPSEEEGISGKQALIAAVLPYAGKYVGTYVEALATKLGISSEAAAATANTLGGAAGATALVSADALNELRKLPPEKRGEAWAEVASNAAQMFLLGLSRGKSRPEDVATRLQRRWQGPIAQGAVFDPNVRYPIQPRSAEPVGVEPSGKFMRPEVPGTPAEPRMTVKEEIRAKDARTKKEIQALFPQLSNEEARQLAISVWGTGGDVGVRVSPTIPIPDRIADRPEIKAPPGAPPPTEFEVAENQRRQDEARAQAQQTGALDQQIITWERELDKALKTGDGDLQRQAIRRLMELRQQRDAVPAPAKRPITPKPAAPVIPRRAIGQEVPGTPAEPREQLTDTIRRLNARTVNAIREALGDPNLPKERAKEYGKAAWGEWPPPESEGATQAPPKFEETTPLPPKEEPPGEEPPPEEPPGPTVPKPPAPPAAPAGGAEAPKQTLTMAVMGDPDAGFAAKQDVSEAVVTHKTLNERGETVFWLKFPDGKIAFSSDPAADYLPKSKDFKDKTVKPAAPAAPAEEPPATTLPANMDTVRTVAGMGGVEFFRQANNFNKVNFDIGKSISAKEAAEVRKLLKQVTAAAETARAEGMAAKDIAKVNESGGLMQKAQFFSEILRHYDNKQWEQAGILAPKEGYVRLYHGQGGAAGAGEGGDFWTTNLEYARNFGKVSYVDVPQAVADAARAKMQKTGTGGPHLILDDEWVRQSKPMENQPGMKVTDVTPEETAAAAADPLASVSIAGRRLTEWMKATAPDQMPIGTQLTALARGLNVPRERRAVFKRLQDEKKLREMFSPFKPEIVTPVPEPPPVSIPPTSKEVPKMDKEPPPAETKPAAPKVAKGPDFEQYGNWKVTLPDGSVRYMFYDRDTAGGVWRESKDGKTDVGRILSMLNKQEAIDNLVKGESPIRSKAPTPATETRLSPEDKAKTPEEKAFRATAEGQKAMASRASRIAILHQLNEAIRKVKPEEAYPRQIIDTLPDSQIDSWLETLRQDYNKFAAKKPAEPTPEAPAKGLEKELFEADSFSSKAASIAEKATVEWATHVEDVVNPLRAKIRKIQADVGQMAYDAKRTTPETKGKTKLTKKAFLAQYGVASMDEANALYKQKNAEWADLEKRLEAAEQKRKELEIAKERRAKEWSSAATRAGELRRKLYPDVTKGDVGPAASPEEPGMGPGAASRREFELPEFEAPDPEVMGIKTGSRAYNRIEHNFKNFYQGIRQLFKRGENKQDLMQLANAADNLPRMAGYRARQSLELRLKDPKEANAVTFIMQALKMSGEGLPPERTAELEYAGNPLDYLKVRATDMETAAQEFLNKGQKLNAEAAKDAAEAMRFAAKNLGRLKPIASAAKAKFDAQIKREQRAGSDVNYEEWYVPQRHEIDLITSGDGPIVLGHARGATSTGFKKAKVFPDYASAIEAGFVPRTFNIGELLEHRVNQGERLLARRALFDRMGSMKDPVDGQPLAKPIPTRIITRPDGTIDKQESVPRDYVPHEVIPGYRVAVHKGYAPLMRALTATSQLSESAVFGALQSAAAVEKHLMLALDTFHASRTMQAELFLTGKLSIGERQRIGRALVEYDPKDLDLAVKKGEITQEMADYIRTPMPIEVGGKTVQMTPAALFQMGARNGLNFARFSDVLYKSWLKDIPITGPVNKWVFDKVTRSAMTQGFISEFQRVAKENPNLSATRVARQVASDINVLFGNLGKESIFKNPSVKAINQLLFLAPNWVEALARREGRTVKQLGKIPGQVLRGEPVRIGTAAKGIGTGLAAYFAATQVLNLITRHHLTFSNPEDGHKLDAWIPDFSGKTKGFFISPLSVFGEITHDILRYSREKPDKAAAIGQILANKLGNMGRLLEVLALGRDPGTNEKLIGVGRRAMAAGAQMVPVPISLTQAGRLGASLIPGSPVSGPAPGAVQRQLAASAGFKTEPAGTAQRQIYAIADKWKSANPSPKIRAEVERRLKEDFGPSDYKDIRSALLRNDIPGARRAFDVLRETKEPQVIARAMRHPHPFTGSQHNERAFRATLSDDQKRLYQEALEERRQLYARYRQMLLTPTK